MPASIASPSQSARAALPTLLIIEDDIEQAELLAWRLKREGYRTLVAHTAQQGLKLARLVRPALLLLDMGLPDIDGLTVSQRLDEAPETRGTPIIVVTGQELPQIMRRCRGVGCRFFVRKPYDPRALLSLVSHVCDQRAGWTTATA